MNTSTLTTVEYAVWCEVLSYTYRDWGTRTDDLVEVWFSNENETVLKVKMPRFEADELVLRCCRIIGGTAMKELRAFTSRDWMPAIWCENCVLSMNAAT